MQADPFRLRVKWPEANVVFGDIQYSLLMGIIFENSSEPSTFPGKRHHISRKGPLIC